MKKILTAFALVAILSSCQKEISIDTNSPYTSGNGGGGSGNGNSGNNSGLLIKTVSVSGTETQTTVYTYDSQKRLETMTMSGTSGGLPVDTYTKYIRDNSGRIVLVKQTAPKLMPGASVDTATNTYHYPNATTQNFDYSIYVITMNVAGMSMSTIDSAVYHYTAAGKMTSFHKYMSSSLMPGSIQMTSRYDFTYDASDRVTNMKLFTDLSNPGGPLDQDTEWKYTYGATGVNNGYTTNNGAQNFALNGLPNTTSNYISKMEVNSPSTTPPLNLVSTFTYVNGANNKPVSGTVVTVTSGQPTQTANYTFFYQ